jgi:dihydropteroate synthase type 2
MECLSNAMKIVGILNVTTDSFSDGSLYVDTQAAIEKGLSLASQGADMVDIGAESSNPDADKISIETEIERITPVIQGLKDEGVALSIDTYKPEVMHHAISLGVDMINDVTGLKNPASIKVVKEAHVPVVIMFSRNQGPHAERRSQGHTTIEHELEAFFNERLKTLHDGGIPDNNVIIDPGMGYFLGGNPEPSLTVLRHLESLKRFGRKIYISTSRKSFIGAVLGRPVMERRFGTLATEIWAYLHGTDYIRTHEPAALRDAIRMLHAIQQIE